MANSKSREKINNILNYRELCVYQMVHNEKQIPSTLWNSIPWGPFMFDDNAWRNIKFKYKKYYIKWC